MKSAIRTLWQGWKFDDVKGAYGYWIAADRSG